MTAAIAGSNDHKIYYKFLPSPDPDLSLSRFDPTPCKTGTVPDPEYNACAYGWINVVSLYAGVASIRAPSGTVSPVLALAHGILLFFLASRSAALRIALIINVSRHLPRAVYE